MLVPGVVTVSKLLTCIAAGAVRKIKTQETS
jgi:hypothetical protein